MRSDQHLQSGFKATIPIAVFVLGFGLLCAGCSEQPGSIEVGLLPQFPDSGAGKVLRWSPKGEKLYLRRDGSTMDATMRLGASGTQPISVRLERTPGSPYYDRLFIDRDRDGRFDADESVTTVPEEIRGRVWSSFESNVNVPATDPFTGAAVLNPYPLNFWFVEDPSTEDDTPVLRFSRQGWMEGSVTIDGVDAVVLLTESVMNGVFSLEDSWALASTDSLPNLYQYEYARSATNHAWLLDQAYAITEIDPSGRRLVLEPFDPGLTRAEEVAIDDHLADDRMAARSGRTVAFLQEFAEADSLARAEGKPLFVDFEADWCGPCHMMDEWVFTADAVVDASSEYVAVKVDGDERPDLSRRFSVEGYPTMLVIGLDGAVLRRAAGYMSVIEMTDFLRGN